MKTNSSSVSLKQKQKLVHASFLAKQNSTDSSQNASFQTCNIQFGRLNITVNSMNTIPTFQSFYETMPLINHNNTETKIDFFEDKVVHSPIVAYACHLNKNLPVQTDDETTENDSIYCWWCRVHRVQKEKACFIPVQYDKYREKYTKCGFFCCWECVKAYNFDINDSKKSYRSYLIQTLCKRLYGIQKAYSIKNARHWSELTEYGGTVCSDLFFTYPKTTLDCIDITLFPCLTRK